MKVIISKLLLIIIFSSILFLFSAQDSFAAICVADLDCPNGEQCLSGICVDPATAQQQSQLDQETRRQIEIQQHDQQQAAAAVSTDDLQRAAAATLNPAGFKKPAEVFARGINALLAFIGSIALVLYIWAGILWMTSAGTAERMEQAKKIMLWTTLGVAVMLGSYVIVTYVFDILS